MCAFTSGFSYLFRSLSCSSAGANVRTICAKSINTCHFAAADPELPLQLLPSLGHVQCHGVLQIISTSDFKRKTREIAVGSGSSSNVEIWVSSTLSTKLPNRQMDNRKAGKGERRRRRGMSAPPLPLMAFLCKLLSAFFVAAKQKASSLTAHYVYAPSACQLHPPCSNNETTTSDEATAMLLLHW